MATEIGELICSVTLEQLAPSGESLRKTIHKSCQLTLGRNEFREIILKVLLGKKMCQFDMREIQVIFLHFRKYVYFSLLNDSR